MNSRRGKGSNQAIQAARLGADVALVAALGQDRFGDEALDLYRRERVSTTYVVRRVERATGVGFITIDPSGENRIVIDPGANELLSPADVDAAVGRIRSSGAVVAQLEIPVDTALYALSCARRAGVLSILNPAPARPLDLSQLADIDVITPNETELRVLCGRAVGADSDPLDDCRNLLQAGVRAVVLTRGARGALIVRPDGHQAIAAPTVEVVDTTGAGDAFTGTLATALAAGQDLERAVQRAVCAGALACTRMGVVPSLPDAAALDATLAAR